MIMGKLGTLWLRSKTRKMFKVDTGAYVTAIGPSVYSFGAMATLKLAGKHIIGFGSFFLKKPGKIPRHNFL